MENENCVECQKTMRKTQVISAGVGLVLGGVLVFGALKLLKK